MKTLLTTALVSSALILGACDPSGTDQGGSRGGQAEAGVIQTAYHDFRIDTVTEGLVHPFAMVFTPDGDLLVTERPGRLRIIRGGELLPKPIQGLPEVMYLEGGGATSMDGREQAGMRDVVLHPDFENNRLLYLSYTRPGPDTLGSLAVARGRFENDQLHDVEEIFVANAEGNGSDRSSMWGGRLVFDLDGYLFVTLGDRQWPSEGDLFAHPAQNLANHNGTTVRIHDDGRIPDDNPFLGQPGVLPEIYSYGHRNAQGMTVHPVTGDVWQNEHGPSGGDEVNLLVPGANYGWPVVGYGVNYGSGLSIHEGIRREGMTDPSHIWVPSIGVSGMIFYEGEAFPHWKGDMLVASLRGMQVSRLTMDGQDIVGEEVLIHGLGRMRDIREAPDGTIYIAMDGDARGFDGDPTPIVRLVPAGLR